MSNRNHRRKFALWSSRIAIIFVSVCQIKLTISEAQFFDAFTANERFFTGGNNNNGNSGYGAPQSGYGTPTPRPSYNTPTPRPAYNNKPTKPSYNNNKPSYNSGGGLNFKNIQLPVPDIDLPDPIEFKAGVLRSKGRIASGLLHAKAGILRAGANILAQKANALDKVAQAIPAVKAGLINTLKNVGNKGGNSGYGAPPSYNAPVSYNQPQAGYGVPQGPVISSNNQNYPGQNINVIPTNSFNVESSLNFNNNNQQQYGNNQFTNNQVIQGNNQFDNNNNNQFIPVGNQYSTGNNQFTSGNNQFNSGSNQFTSGNNQFTSGNNQFSNGNTQYNNNQFNNGNNQFSGSVSAPDSYGSPLATPLGSTSLTSNNQNTAQLNVDSGLSSFTNNNQALTFLSSNDNSGIVNNGQFNPFLSSNSLSTPEKLLLQESRLQQNSGNGLRLSSSQQLCSSGNSDVLQNLLEDIFMGNELIPDVLDNPPIYPLELTYKTIRTFPGMKLTADMTRFKPMLHWPAQPDSLYTVVLSNLDINNRRNRTLAEFWHWFVANIPGDSVDEGEVIFEHLFPLVLPEGNGNHRFGYFVFEQPTAMDYSEEGGPTDACSPNMSNGRGPFKSTKNFQKKYGLELTAATFIILDYNDASMNIACEWQKCIGDTINLVSPLKCGADDG